AGEGRTLATPEARGERKPGAAWRLSVKMHSPEPVRSYTTHRPPGVHFSDSADAPDDPTLTAPHTPPPPPTTPRPPTPPPPPPSWSTFLRQRRRPRRPHPHRPLSPRRPPDDAEAPDDLAAPDAPDAPDAPPCYGGERCRPRLGPARCDLCRNLGEALTGHIRGH